MTHPFTPTYIAMAKAAKEIQAMKVGVRWCPDHNEEVYYHHEMEDYTCDSGTDGPYGGSWHTPDKPIFLPPLDQLLGMLGKPENAVAAMVGATHEHDIEFNSYAIPFKDDWHELTLAVVMREKYGKTWDGKGWAKA